MNNQFEADNRQQCRNPEPPAKGHLCPTEIEVSSPDQNVSSHRPSPALRTSAPAGEEPRGKTQASSERQRLVEILEGFDIPVASFDGLRSDSYEKQLAVRSLDELEAFYGRLLKPGEGCEAIQEHCPRWETGSRYAGKLPSVRTLSGIKRRIADAQMVQNVEQKMDLLKEVARRLAGRSMAEKSEMINGLLALMNAEMLGLKQEGKPIVEQLPAVDRVIKAVATQSRVEQGDTRNRLYEEIKGGRLKLDREKYEYIKLDNERIIQAQSPPLASGQPPASNTKALITKVFGKNPYKNENN